MKNTLSSILMILLMLGIVTNIVYAKRFGGGRSFGVQRAQSSLFSPRHQATAPSASPSSRWGGMLGGLLIGGLLASLFMGHGLATGLLSWLFVGMIVLSLVGLWRRRTSFAGSAGSGPFQSIFANAKANATATNQYAAESSELLDFSKDDFLREAKVKFIRLQAAFDKKDLQDLRDFTAPEVFAEIQMQLDERGDAVNQTDVLKLNAQLLDVTKQVDSSIASVHFTGLIKEEDAAPIPLDEVWHFRQFTPRGEWVVGGIQQVQ
jgi:predicted lipid-binding transport protein (Tim44 family)